jgi:hypothetical protein
MRITSAGNVGIGTSSPAVRLTGRVLSLNDTQSSIELLNNQSSAGEIFSNSTGTVLAEFRNLPMQFRANNIERMRIAGNGNVGIGTTAPTAPLDVNGVRMGRNFSLANRATVRLDAVNTSSPSDVLFGHTGAANQTGWTGVYWSLSSRAAAGDNSFQIWRGAGNPGGSGEDVITTWLPNGNVGIGTTSPSERLHVVGNILASGSITAGVVTARHAVGAYIYAFLNTGTVLPNNTVPGSQLGGGGPGTWRNMGNTTISTTNGGLLIRIS